jgi:broad specificity phosphatase PhoE
MRYSHCIFFCFFSFVVLFSGIRASDQCTNSDVCSIQEITRFLLIRHGKTDWNVQGKIQGHSDIPLNVAGIAQAKSVAKKLFEDNEKVDAIYSSDLERAFFTAQEISSLFNKTIVTDAALREIFMGVAEGINQTEYQHLYKIDQDKLTEFFSDRWDRWQHTVVPDAETIAETLIRIETFLRKIAQNHKGNTVVVVTHGAVIKTLIYHDTEVLAHTPNCCIAIFEYSHEYDTFSFIEMKKI